jgi:peptide/nickel transport system substrate-binding protein
MSVVPRHVFNGYSSHGFGQHPIGTGAYVLDEWKSGERITLKANESHYDGKPGIDRIIFNIIPEASARFMELKSGNVDEIGLTPTQYTKQTDDPEFVKRTNKFRYQGYNYTYMGFNFRVDKFADKRVRQGISYALDRGSIIDGVLDGLGSPCSGPFSPLTWAYNPAVKPHGYNPEKAKSLLAQAGWKDTDGDGILDKGGEPFSFTLITNHGNETRKKTAEIIQQNLKEVGIEVRLKVLEWQTFLEEFVIPGNFEAVLIGWNISVDPDMYDIWHSSKTNKGEFNFVHYKNDEVDRLIMEGRETFDLEKRKAAYRRIHEIIADETPYAFLYIPDSLIAVDKRFKGIKVAPAGITYNFEDWYIPQDSNQWYQ